MTASSDIRPIDITDRGVVGYEIWHPRKDDPEKQCGVSVATAEWGGDWEVKWKILQEEPLTLTPSIVCVNCPAHGFVRDGVFVY
jgi:hypothetical protein